MRYIPNIKILVFVLLLSFSISCTAKRQATITQPETADIARIHIGMEGKDVKKILGEPFIILGTSRTKTWRYGLIVSEDPINTQIFSLTLLDDVGVDYDGAER